LTRLELKHAELEFEMRKILQKPPETLTEAEKEREEAIMEEIVKLVNKRDKLMEQIENEEEINKINENTQIPETTKGK
jgi:hypothetical protein